MAHVKRSYTATETVVQWVLGTRPNGKYFRGDQSASDLEPNRENARFFLSEKAAKEALAMSVSADLRGKLRVIRVSRTTRESCED